MKDDTRVDGAQPIEIGNSSPLVPWEEETWGVECIVM